MTQTYPVTEFEPQLAVSLPETFALLRAANLTVHPSVSGVVLHGSRGPARRFRPESDIDLSLLVDLAQDNQIENLLRDVTQITMENWRSEVELDLAVIFDVRNCGLTCFEQTMWKPDHCQIGGVDCFGLYKTQKGFNGLVTDGGIQVRLMYPCLKIWQRRDND